MNACVLHSSLGVRRFTELDCLVDGHKHLLEDVKGGERNSIVLLRRGEIHIMVMPVHDAGYSMVTRVSWDIVALPQLFEFFTIPSALSKMDDLLNEMKADLSKLPFQLAKIDSVTNQLQMKEMSILSRMASHFAPSVAAVEQHKQSSTVVISIDTEQPQDSAAVHTVVPLNPPKNAATPQI